VSCANTAGYGCRIVLVWLADAIAAVHFAYLAFIPVGGFLAARWRRLLLPHLVAVAVGTVSVTVGFDCPFTAWEQSLRRAGGQRAYTEGFVVHYLTGRVYPHGYAWAVQVLFAICVAAAYAVIVGRRLRQRRVVHRQGSRNGSTIRSLPSGGVWR
jgi:hypothetical protein